MIYPDKSYESSLNVDKSVRPKAITTDTFMTVPIRKGVKPIAIATDQLIPVWNFNQDTPSEYSKTFPIIKAIRCVIIVDFHISAINPIEAAKKR